MDELTKAAMKRYESFMAKYIEDDIHTDAEIRQQHQNALAIINSYKIKSILPPNQWQGYLHQISDCTTDRVKFFIRSNQENIKNQSRLRKTVWLDTQKDYEEVLCRYHGTVGNAAQLSEFLPIAQTFGWGVYQRNAAENFLPHASWLPSILEELENVQTERVRSDPNCTHVHGAMNMSHEDFVKKFQKMHNSLFPGSFALILHQKSSSVRGAVYKTDNNLSKRVFLQQWPFFIVFKGNQTLINLEESDALKSGGIDLNMKLTMATREPYMVFIRNQEETLELEEILSMYFYKAKREIETKLNVAFTYCVMVISPYLSTRGKHILKTSLSLAGFQNSALLHSTTATDLGLKYPPTNSVRANTRDETILWGGFQSTKKKVVEVSKVSAWANRSKQSIDFMDILRYIPEKLNILSDDKIIKLISVNDQLPKKAKTVYFGKYYKITLCEMLGDGPNNSDHSHHIATISKGERHPSCGVGIEVEFSSEGLVQITSTLKASKSPSQHNLHIQLSYMGPEKMAKSKKMLWTKYFRDKNYFDISWKQFLEKTQRFEGREQSGNGDVGSGSTTAQEQSQLELQRLLKQLKVYAEKVEMAGFNNSNSVTNERILEKIREDLQHCQRFLRETGPNTQVRDVERQLTKLKISSSTLNIL